MLYIPGSGKRKVVRKFLIRSNVTHTKVVGCWRGPFSAYFLGRPCFATYKVNICQFS
jgi:hypothetical protein